MASIADLFVMIGADISEFKKEIADMQSTLKDAGQGLKDAGASMTAGITAPLAGIGLVALNAAADVERGSGKIQAQLGLTEKEAERLHDVSINLWRNAFGGSVEEAADAVSLVSRNMQYITGDELESVTEKAFILADVFGADIGQSTKTADQLMAHFGTTATEAFDLMTAGYQNGLDFSDELLDSINEYAPQFAALGFGAKDMFETFAAGADAGAFNLDKVGDAAKEFNIRIKDGSKTTADAMALLSKDTQGVWQSFLDGKATGKDAFQTILQELSTMDDKVEASQIGVSLFGTQWEDLETDVMAAMSTSTNYMDGFEGSTERAGQAIYDNIGTKATEVWRDLLSAITPIGTILLDLASKILPPLSAAIGVLSAWFESLNPTIQYGAVVFGLVAAAIGPLLIVAGFLVQAISALAPLFVLVKGAIAAATIPIWPIIAAIGALIAIGVLLYQNWDTVRAYAVQIWQAILDFIRPAVDAIRAFIMEKFDQVLAFWKQNGDQILQAGKNVWDFLVKVIKGALDLIWGVMQAVWPLVKMLIQGTWDAIKNIVNGAINIILGIIKTFASLFTGDWQGLWEGIKTIISGALELIWGWVQLFGAGRLLKFFGEMGGKVVTLFKDMWSKVKYEFEFKMLEIFDKVKSVFGKIMDFIKGLGDSFKAAGKGLIEMMAKGITGAASKVIDAAKSLVGKVRDFLPFSPAKDGPLSDLDRLDFGGPIGDSLISAMPKVKALMGDLLQMPTIQQTEANFAGGPGNYDNGGQTVYNFERMFEGAEMNFNDETDPREIAKEFYYMTVQKVRAQGGRMD